MSRSDNDRAELPDDNSVQAPWPNVRVRVRTRVTSAESAQAEDPALPPGAAHADYEVGYRKPPRHAQFKRGNSGNPKGRPKNAKGLNTIVRETLGGKVAVRTATGTKRISKIEAVLQKTLEKAMKGDSRAQLELMKLWRSAVPDIADNESEATPDGESITAADLATLDAYRASLTDEECGGE